MTEDEYCDDDEEVKESNPFAAPAADEAAPLLAPATTPATLIDHREGPLSAALTDDPYRCRHLSLGAATYAAPGAGVTALHVAAGGGASRAARALLGRDDAAALVAATDGRGATPLAHAVDRGRMDIVVALCAAGAACDGPCQKQNIHDTFNIRSWMQRGALGLKEGARNRPRYERL
jgi:hypothetical protein